MQNTQRPICPPLPLGLALVPLHNFLINFKIFQWKSPLHTENDLALSKMKFQAWYSLPLKECYRIDKKQKSWRSQIYIKFTRSSDDDSWKHPMKYFCLKCHFWRKINNLTLQLEFIAHWAFYSLLFWHWCNAKCVIGFSLFSRNPDGRLISNFYRLVSLCIWQIT